RLTGAIRRRWHDSGDLLDRLLKYSGPLASFSARIDVGFAIGLYGDETKSDLHILRKVRNDFAHELMPKTFIEVKDRIANLKIPDKYPILSSPKKVRVLSTPPGIEPNGYELAKMLVGGSSLDDITEPRHRFIRAVEILSGLLFSLHDPATPKTEPQF